MMTSSRELRQSVVSASFFLLLLIVSIFLSLVPVSAYATAPGAPTIGPTSAGSGQVTVNFTPPVSDGGSPITGYTVTSSPDGITAPGTSSPITVTGLTNGRVYTFTVTATNGAGQTSIPSAPSYNTTPRLYAPATGIINNLVVFIRFSDQPSFNQPLSYYDAIFNSAANSLKNFYLESSYGALTVNSTFYPLPVGDVSAPVLSYQDSNPVSYYQGAGAADREKALITNALNSVSADINASGLNLDGDSDGYIDHITFEVYSSNLNPQPVTFNSRATYDTSSSVVINGLKVGSYTWVTATQDSSYPANSFASVEIHEMGHNFGYPDLRNNFNGFEPVGNWDIMANAFSTVHSGAYMKNKITHWIPNIPELTSTSYGTYTINDITQATNNSYKIKLPNTNEFLVLEYRPGVGIFESHLPGKGLCITRVNEAAGIWGNMNGPPFFLYYFRPGGTLLSDGSAANLFTCLDAASGQTQFNDYSNPACFLSDGSPCGISIYNIGTASGSSISFSIGDPATTTVTHAIKGNLVYGNTTNRVSGATVTLSGDATGMITTTTGTPSYIFTVNSGGNYTVTPTKANVIFSPLSVTVSNVTSEQTLSFSATKITNTISGTVTLSGTPVSSIPVRISCPVGASYTGSMQTDGTGAYSFIVDAGSTCDVWAQKTSYAFLPYTKRFTNVITNQVQNFAINPSNVTFGGKITYNGTNLAGIDVSCTGANTETPSATNGSGTYSFGVTIGDGSVYTVTPSSPLYKFSPISIGTAGAYSNQLNMDFTASLKATSATVLGSSLNPGVLGDSVTFTAAVTGSSPTGTVTFSDGITAVCAAVPLSNGQAQCITGSLGVGSHSITAVYSGDGDNTAGTSAVLTQVVTPLLPTEYALTITKIGSGTVLADNNPLPWAGVISNATYPEDVSVSLTATADQCYSFDGWSGDYQSYNRAAPLKMDRDWLITATFSLNLPAYNATRNLDYSTLAGIYQTAADGDIIDLQEVSFDEVLQIDKTGLIVTGGVDCDYELQNAATTIKQLVIGNGSAVVDRIVIQ